MTHTPFFSSPLQALDVASCHAAAQRISAALQKKESDEGLSTAEIKSLLGILEFYACCENWEKIIDLSSQALLVGVGPNAALEFYRFWCEALRESYNLESLQTLSKHFISQARHNQNYAALSLLTLCYTGRANLAKALAKHLKSFKSQNTLTLESYAIYLGHSSDKKERAAGLKIYQNAIEQKSARYFSYLNFINQAIENEQFEQATQALNNFQERYPLAPYANMVAAQLELTNENPSEALPLFQNVLDCNGKNQDALLGFAICLEQSGDVLAAKNFLLENEHAFDFSDADYCVTLGRILEKTAARYKNNADKKLAVNYYASALRTYQKLKLPEASLHIKLADLQAGVMENKVAQSSQNEQHYWLLSLEEIETKKFLTNENLIVRCPQDAKKGDVVFVACKRQGEKQMHIEGFYTVTSNIVPDAYYGNAMRLGDRKVFDNSIDIKPDSHIQPHVDAHHVKNFSETSQAAYYEIPHSFAEKIVERVEAMADKSYLKQKAI